MRMFATLLAASGLAIAAPALATEVDVTRFHTPDSLAQGAPGPVMVRAVAGLDADSLESRVWLDAVSRQLERQGFTVVADAPRVVEVSLQQGVTQRVARGGGIQPSVGVGSASARAADTIAAAERASAWAWASTSAAAGDRAKCSTARWR